MLLDDGQVEKSSFHGCYHFGTWEVEMGRSKVIFIIFFFRCCVFHALFRSAPARLVGTCLATGDRIFATGSDSKCVSNPVLVFA